MFLQKIFKINLNSEQCNLCHNIRNIMKMQKIYKCKRCDRLVCYRCSKHKIQLLTQECTQTKQLNKICNQCWLDSQQIRTFIIEHKAQWNKNSNMMDKWLELIKEKNQNVQFQYAHFLNLFGKNQIQYQKEIQIIQKDVFKGRTDINVFNTSMKQFLYKIQRKKQTETVQRNIANVLYALSARFHRIGYCQGMSGIIAILLCLGDQQSSFIVFCDLLINIYPRNFFQENNFGVMLDGLLVQINYLQEQFHYLVMIKKKDVLLQQMQTMYGQQEWNQFKIIIELVAAKIFLCLFVDIVSFSNLMFIWRQLCLKRQFSVIQRAFLALIYLNRNIILVNRNYKKVAEFFISMSHEQFKQAYYDIELNNQLKKKVKQKHEQDEYKKWYNKSMIKTLIKVTNFTEKQIKILIQYFKPNKITQQIEINEQKFIRLIKCYYKCLKNERIQQGQYIVQINENILHQIYQIEIIKQTNLKLFRQFIRLLSMCIKCTLRQYLCLILNTYKNQNNLINYQNIELLMNQFYNITPIYFFKKKQQFKKRLDLYFENDRKIHINNAYILFNDCFINELTTIVKFTSQGIIEKMIQSYQNF